PMRAFDFWWGLAGGVAGAVALTLFYRALAVGSMGVISPISAVIATVVPVLYGIVHGERPSVHQDIGIAVAPIALWFVSFKVDVRVPRTNLRGLRRSLAAGVAFGLFYICLAQTHRDAGLFPLLGSRAGSVCLLAAAAFIARQPVRPLPGTMKVISLAGFLDMSANALFISAAHHGMIAIAAVLTSLYPASTVFLARIVLKERLQRTQIAGVLCALVAVVLIAH
ncbi:MAG: DMT family transporter, partial [Candidatus Eremiobacteraeota bacterium]|nr:DMT family transporter [Candidatus Eremiobacteraeota bacterium]